MTIVPARRLGGGSNLRAEKEVVNDRDDHGKIIPDMLIRTAAVPPFYKNGYLVACAKTRAGVLIDPGDEVAEPSRCRRTRTNRCHEDPADARASRPRHRRRRGQGATWRGRLAPPRRRVPVRRAWSNKAGCSDSTWSASRPSTISTSRVRRCRSANAPWTFCTRPATARAASAWLSAMPATHRATCSWATRCLPDRSAARIFLAGIRTPCFDPFARCSFRFRTRRSSIRDTVRLRRSARRRGQTRS